MKSSMIRSVMVLLCAFAISAVGAGQLFAQQYRERVLRK